MNTVKKRSLLVGLHSLDASNLGRRTASYRHATFYQLGSDKETA